MDPDLLEHKYPIDIIVGFCTLNCNVLHSQFDLGRYKLTNNAKL